MVLILSLRGCDIVKKIYILAALKMNCTASGLSLKQFTDRNEKGMYKTYWIYSHLTFSNFFIWGILTSSVKGWLHHINVCDQLWRVYYVEFSLLITWKYERFLILRHNSFIIYISICDMSAPSIESMRILDDHISYNANVAWNEISEEMTQLFLYHRLYISSQS